MKPERPPTDFEQAVYQLVRGVPAGKVTTYGNIAKQLQRGSARSVGTALARNPFAPEVPCHRVVRSNGHLGGFHGETHGPRMDEKQRMLESEGVPFPSIHQVSPAAILTH